ncbi:MAG: ferritin [Planctomycetes bacterium RBG_13_60_9]|nr:MAG: ferritin [Planctomycetes bacterium RBG_13_60_9]
MGTKGQEIVKLDVENVLSLLNKAFADEWLAYYQYWAGAQVAKGPMRGAVVAELNEHAGDELKHAGMLAARIIQLGGTPVLDPADWKTSSNCGYDAPVNPHVQDIVEQNVKGEQCAIDVYNKLVGMTRDKDIVTYHLVAEILADEVEHEEDLQALLEDMAIVRKQK